MKISPIVAGFLLFTGALLSAGGAGEDVSLTTKQKDSSASLPEKKGASPMPDGPDYGSGRRALEDTVQIVAVKEDKPGADGSRKVTVKVRYVLISAPKGMLALGFNLKSATKYVAVTQREVMSGIEDREISATIVPVKWPKDQPFKVYVSLTSEPHPKQWSLLAAVSQAMKPAAVPAPAASESTTAN